MSKDELSGPPRISLAAPCGVAKSSKVALIFVVDPLLIVLHACGLEVVFLFVLILSFLINLQADHRGEILHCVLQD